MFTPDLWLIRHGATEWSVNRRHTGRTDLPLLPEGEEQAALLAPRLQDVTFDLQLASPLRRAWRTAELAGLKAEAEPDALEWDYGLYEGRTSAEIKQDDPDWSIWDRPVPGGESLADVARRADAVVARVRSSAPERAVLVAHAHFLRVLAARWMEVDALVGEHLVLETATISVLGWDRGTPVIDRWNV